MKKITYAKAKKLIGSGITVKALIARNEIPVRTLNDLENLNRLAQNGVQDFELFYEPVNVRIPENAMEVSLDDAITLSYGGEKIFSLHKSKEICFSTPDEILQHYKNCNLYGTKCTFYWYVD